MKYILPLFLFISIISCESTDKNDVNVELGENKEFDDLPKCNCDSLVIDKDNNLTLSNSIFTGICFLNYPNGDQKYIEKQILDGAIHGKITYFDKSGNILIEEVYNEGKLTSDESKSRCNCTELTMKKGENDLNKHFLNESLFTGQCEDFFPNSEQLYLESNYKDGLLHGYTVYYQKDGSVLMMQDYKDGILIEEIVSQ